MNQNKTFALVFILLANTLFSNAQDHIIAGRVFTFDSIPLVHANVQVKSTKQVVLSDSLGNFSVKCMPDDVLKVSAKGFITAKVDIDEKIKVAIVNLKLKPGDKNREIAIGYGYVLDSEKLNAVASLNNDDFDFSSYSNIFEMVQGRFAGVQVVNGEFVIRGVNSINSDIYALVILDGTQVNSGVLGSISPTEVKSINVIKDGSAAIYGSRGSNGVVIIETKRGGDR